MPYPFGKDFTYKYFPVDSEGEYIDMSSVTDAPSIYVFTSKPSLTDARAGTGAAQTISSWSNATADDDANGKSFTVSAISDPEPTGPLDRYDYYIAINHVLVDSGDTVTVLKLLPMERIQAHHAPIDVTEADLEEVFQHVDNYASSAQQANYIDLAVKDTRALLDNRGYEWAQVWEPDDLKRSIVYRAVSYIFRSHIAESGDHYTEQYAEHKKMAGLLLDNLRLRYDNYRSGEPTSETKTAGFLRQIR